MSRESGTPVASVLYEGPPSDHAGPAANGDWQRELLWQQVWEYLVHACRERAARRQDTDGQSVRQAGRPADGPRAQAAGGRPRKVRRAS